MTRGVSGLRRCGGRNKKKPVRSVRSHGPETRTTKERDLCKGGVTDILQEGMKRV